MVETLEGISNIEIPQPANASYDNLDSLEFSVKLIDFRLLSTQNTRFFIWITLSGILIDSKDSLYEKAYSPINSNDVDRV